MGFGQAVKSCFEKYAEFHGRARLSEYRYFYLFVILVIAALFIVGEGLKSTLGYAASAPFTIVFILIWLVAFLVPSFAVTVRRLHDTNSSGWWILRALIPYLGGFALLVWYCIKGTAGENRFGPDPLAPDTVEAFD